MRQLKKIIVLLILIFATTLLSQTKEQLFKSAIESLSRHDTTSAISTLQKSIRKFDDNQAYFLLAKLYLTSKSFLKRNFAYDYLKRIVLKEPNNLEYRYAYADLCKDFARVQAFKEYEKILEQDTLEINAYLELGKMKAKDFDEYNNSVRPADEFTFSLQEYADTDFVEAEKYFLKGLKIDSTNYNACFQLAQLYQKGGKYQQGIDLLNKLIEIGKADKNVYLALALLYYKVSKLKNCYNSFLKAFAYMDKNELEDFTFNSVKFLIEPAFKDIIEKLDDYSLRSFIEKYWKFFDPLYLTGYNERLLEHYARVAFSNLYFSVPKLGIVGWKTNRGEVVIRYGEPESLVRLRPFMGERGVNLKTEVWDYGVLTLAFTDLASTGHYKFSAPAAEKDRVKSQYAGDTHSLMQYLRKSTHSIYNPKFEGSKFDVPFTYSQFKNLENKNSTDVYVSYGLLKADSLLESKEILSGYDVGFTFFDFANYNESLQQKKSIDKLSESTFKVEGTLEPLHIQTLKITYQPDSGYAAFEIIRKKDNGVFADKSKFTFKEFSSNNLAISSIFLALQVDENNLIPGSIYRNGLSILPKPNSYFTKGEPLIIYYEVYNLHKQPDDLCNYIQRISITKIEEEKGDIESLVSSIGKLIGIGGEEKLTLTSNYKTAEVNPQVFLQIDMSGYSTGRYLLNVEIEDNLSKKAVSSKIMIDYKN